LESALSSERELRQMLVVTLMSVLEMVKLGLLGIHQAQVILKKTAIGLTILHTSQNAILDAVSISAKRSQMSSKDFSHPHRIAGDPDLREGSVFMEYQTINVWTNVLVGHFPIPRMKAAGSPPRRTLVQTADGSAGSWPRARCVFLVRRSCPLQ